MAEEKLDWCARLMQSLSSAPGFGRLIRDYLGTDCSSVRVPFWISDDEELARRCEPREARPDNIKASAFIRKSSFPFDVSLSRLQFGDALTPEDITKKKTYVTLLAGEARRVSSRPIVRVRKPPKHHAILHPRGVDPQAYRTHEEIEASAWKNFLTLVDELIEIAKTHR